MSTSPPAALDALETLALASVALGERLLDGVALGGSARSLVLRAGRADGESVVVKRFAPATDAGPGPTGYAREMAGLELLERTPALLAAADEHQLIVMQDVGDHATLADLLRGDDPDAAWAGAMQWARALGELIAGASAAVGRAAERLGSDPERAGREMAKRLRSGVERLAATAGIEAPGGLVSELTEALRMLMAAGRLALSPGDTCPDNVMLTPDGVMFVDLEGTDVKPMAFDAAYALAPFATCWCVYAEPPGFTDAMLAAFEDGLRARAPELIPPGWDTQVVVAATMWALWMSSVLLNHTADPDRRLGPPEAPAMTMRQLVLLRLDWVAARAVVPMPAAAGFAATAAAGLRRCWGDLDLPVYPAWAGCR